KMLGVTIVGLSSARGDKGIFVESITKGSVVHVDGRIKPNDLLKHVNNIPLKSLTNDQAVDILRKAVERRGRIRITVATDAET
ncbi:hypothetical protein PMAYCL1PPCAC_28269, partial [Pristionchus mayeri]